MQQFANDPPQAQNMTPDWMQSLADVEQSPYQAPALPAGTPVNAQEQRYIASLDDLERDLQSQGFVPMEPGSLASIAQAQANISASTQPQQEIQPSLSSALAQLGNLGQQQPALPTNNEPWWNAQNREQSAPPDIPQTPGGALNPFAALGARTNEEAPSPFAPLPATPAPIAPAANGGQSLMPAYRSDALLDDDLETTMKRPAITLQPMKAGESRGERAAGNGKGRGERRHIEHVDESNLSNHERLIRGYQYQLSGAYEESMQEYRLIIRNAPELLEDVISNLRALLKINPRFSLGYRVLGDAYMRKGEYLQAMEAYNKALTMAKKAKN
jgi:tetratricopeptide (TPR) repeat protein